MKIDAELQSPPANTILTATGSGLNAIPVLILGASVTGIGVTRIFGRSRVPIYGVCAEADLLVKSKWFRPVERFDQDPPRPANLAEFLENIDIPTAVLMPCADDWAVAVSQLSGSIKERFPSIISRFEVLETFTDKWRFAQMLQREELPHPSTLLLQSLPQMEALEEGAYRGRFLKPCASLTFARKHGVKAFFISNKAEALNIMAKEDENSFPILLQEYVPGPPTNHVFVDGYVDRKGDIRALFARRRLRMYPPLFGNSTLMETIPISEAAGAIATIRRMFNSLGFVGIFSAEFKFDDRSGEFRILEVNARPWWFVEFAARCGVDVCMLAYREALGLPIKSVDSYPIGRRGVYLAQDFKAFRREHTSIISLGTWVKSWLGAEETLFARDDFGPSIAYYGGAFRTGFRRPTGSR